MQRVFRFPVGAASEARTAFARDLLEALAREGVEPGHAFFIARSPNGLPERAEAERKPELKSRERALPLAQVEEFPDRMTLAAARTSLEAVLEDGASCPVCHQFAKIYKRRINSGMARSLITMYRVGGVGWQHIPSTVGGRSREEGKLAHWGLILEEKALRPDGGRAGYWRLTEKGVAWVRGTLAVKKYARIYDGHCLGLVGDAVTIRDALGYKFDYDELMGRPATQPQGETK